MPATDDSQPQQPSARSVESTDGPGQDSLGIVRGEYEVIDFWHKQDIWAKLVRAQKDRPQFNFFDGPPFATGLPHYGHICISMVKDCVMRYKAQMGYKLNYSFGWDCHGLPIEFEINKKLGIKTPQEVKDLGIAKYNQHCRDIVMKFSNEWQSTIERIGRWTDFDNDYKTMNPEFMESVWNVFKQLYEKDLVYKGFKVMPYSTGCNTPLSNFEATLDYRVTNDPSVIVKFPLKLHPNVVLLAWTTTPWTLPSNLALCVHPNKEYVKIKATYKKTVKKANIGDQPEFYIVMKCRLAFLKNCFESYEIIEKFKGITLVGQEFLPLFQYFEHLKISRPNVFTILADEYVTEDSGTGVVQQAPYFGVDDFRVGMKNGLIKKGECVACPIDECGLFTDEVMEYQGMYFKETDPLIIKRLKEHNRLLINSSESHNYPYCWRSHTPLIYKAVSSWFINIEKIKRKLIKSNQGVNWVPESIKNGRFGNWLENAQDWLVSRNRYWGCPLPLWVSEDGDEVVCIGSIDELKQKTGCTDITDLHCDKIDHLLIDSSQGKGKLRRVSEVFDCWFESGSVPYASLHYPFENKDNFLKNFPVDFITEGIDQCRGWFYTLMILSTALFEVSPFKNCVTLGLIMAEDGQKMSKSKQNYPDPMQLIDKYGADALRIYLTSTPVMHGASISFKEADVADYLKQIIIQYHHSSQFLQSSINLFNQRNPGGLYEFQELSSVDDMTDNWIISLINSLIYKVHSQMDQYLLYKIIPNIPTFINSLNNWYIKINRPRLKGHLGISAESNLAAINTLFYVLFSAVKILAPFIPFISERIYQDLKKIVSNKSKVFSVDESVHMSRMPVSDDNLVNVEAELQMEDIQSLITLIRGCRDKAKISFKRSIQKCHVFCSDNTQLSHAQASDQFIKSDSNVKIIEYHSSIDQHESFGIKVVATANQKVLAKRITKQFKNVTKALPDVEQKVLLDYQRGQEIEIAGVKILPNDLLLTYTMDGCSSDDVKQETTQREIISQVQQARKEMMLQSTDRVQVVFDTSNPFLEELYKHSTSTISSVVNCEVLLRDMRVSSDQSKNTNGNAGPGEFRKFDLKLSQTEDSVCMIVKTSL